MRYFFCIILPPIAVLSTGRIGAFILSLILTLLGWIPGVIYAVLITNRMYSDRRHKEMIAALSKTNRT
ncbi:MAG TPA: YqaE/Pmp3 family membrane protein [Flavobacteriales bacterium]|nr:YqaE/Pmp3 family membrane protein [Flavobacteriales bacterium]